MNLPHSTYYHKPKSVTKDDPDLLSEIEAIIEEFPGYGYRRVTRELHRRSKPVNHKKVLRIMRERGLIRKPMRCWVRTTDSHHGHRVYPNLLQNLAITGPNQVWAADMTYISIRRMPSCIWRSFWISLPVEPWVMPSPVISTPFCAWRPFRWPLKIAALQKGSSITPIASRNYIEMLLKHGFRISVSRKGNPYDNAAAESFFKTLKVEEVYLWEYRTLEDVQNRLSFFIQDVYNHKRLHSSLGYRPPV